MKSIDYLTTEERVAASLPFGYDGYDDSPQSPRMHFVDELRCNYSEEQLDELDDLLKRSCTQTMIRLLQFLTEPKTDKQILARIICVQKLLNNQHGNWQRFTAAHDITIKTVRAQRDILKEKGLKIK